MKKATIVNRTCFIAILAAVALTVSTVGPAHAASAGKVSISCKTDVVFGVLQNNQDCIGTANGVIVAPDGNLILIQGDPLWDARKATQPCANDPKPRGGKCYDNFRAYDLVVDETGPTNPMTAQAWGRFEVKGIDISKGGAPVTINGSFDYIRIVGVAVVTIPSKHVLADTKDKGTNGWQIKEAGKSYPPCAANPSGGGFFMMIPKAVPVAGVKSTVWVSGTANFAC